MAALPKMIYGSTQIGTVIYNGKEVFNIVEQQSDGSSMTIYHKHTGNRNTGGGCYTKKVTHKHIGNPSIKGGCYTIPVYHSHTDSCYPQKTMPACYWGQITYPASTVPGINTGDYWRCTCSCGEVAEGSTAGGISVVPGSMHKAETTIADRTKDPTCGKTESSIDNYDLGCNKTEASIEYQLGCGFDTN